MKDNEKPMGEGATDGVTYPLDSAANAARRGEDLPTLMQFFSYAHLPERLQFVSEPFSRLAEAIVRTVPRNPERTVALRKLLESKDAAVRAFLAK